MEAPRVTLGTKAVLILTSLLLLFLSLTIIKGDTAKAANKSFDKQSGNVQANLSFQQRGFKFSSMQLRIARQGQELLNTSITPPCQNCILQPAGLGRVSPLKVRDLDGDSEPEVILDLFTGGAHCCTFSQIYSFDPGRNSYRLTKHNWRDSGYTLRDLNSDGIPEFKSSDARFALQFTFFAASVFPVQILQFNSGQLTDVTKKFRTQVAQDAKNNLGLYHSQRDKRGSDVRGILAAYLADKYLLNQKSSGLKVIRRANRRGDLRRLDRFDIFPANQKYITHLKNFLVRKGYS